MSKATAAFGVVVGAYREPFVGVLATAGVALASLAALLIQAFCERW